MPTTLTVSQSVSSATASKYRRSGRILSLSVHQDTRGFGNDRSLLIMPIIPPRLPTRSIVIPSLRSRYARYSYVCGISHPVSAKT